MFLIIGIVGSLGFDMKEKIDDCTGDGDFSPVHQKCSLTILESISKDRVFRLLDGESMEVNDMFYGDRIDK